MITIINNPSHISRARKSGCYTVLIDLDPVSGLCRASKSGDDLKELMQWARDYAK